MEKKKDINLKEYSSMKIGGTGEVVIIENESEIPGLMKSIDKFWVIGEGTNTVFSDGIIKKTLIINRIKGFDVLDEDANSVTLRIGAGENWDSVVQRTVQNKWSGIEALSAIPGSVGASPVQNIGAYGVEVSDVILSVRVFDIDLSDFRWMSKKECEFGYRDSIFKRNPEKYIVTAIEIFLSKEAPNVPDYSGVKNYFVKKEIPNPSISDIRNAITEIRWSKLPKPNEIPNCGSYFKNTVVREDVLKKIQSKYPDVPNFKLNDGDYKIPSAWFIDTLGLKGECFNKICIYKNHALVLSNPSGEASFENLKKAEEKIKSLVKDEFGVDLEREPVFCE